MRTSLSLCGVLRHAGAVGDPCQLWGDVSGRANVADGSGSNHREPDVDDDELTLKMSGTEAAARCTKSRPPAGIGE